MHVGIINQPPSKEVADLLACALERFKLCHLITHVICDDNQELISQARIMSADLILIISMSAESDDLKIVRDMKGLRKAVNMKMNRLSLNNILAVDIDFLQSNIEKIVQCISEALQSN